MKGYSPRTESFLWLDLSCVVSLASEGIFLIQDIQFKIEDRQVLRFSAVGLSRDECLHFNLTDCGQFFPQRGTREQHGIKFGAHQDDQGNHVHPD